MITKRKIIIFKLDDPSLSLSPFALHVYQEFKPYNIRKMGVMQSMQIELKMREKRPSTEKQPNVKTRANVKMYTKRT